VKSLSWSGSLWPRDQRVESPRLHAGRVPGNASAAAVRAAFLSRSLRETFWSAGMMLPR
jgi:hypothetical protein